MDYLILAIAVIVGANGGAVDHREHLLIADMQQRGWAVTFPPFKPILEKDLHNRAFVSPWDMTTDEIASANMGFGPNNPDGDGRLVVVARKGDKVFKRSWVSKDHPTIDGLILIEALDRLRTMTSESDAK